MEAPDTEVAVDITPGINRIPDSASGPLSPHEVVKGLWVAATPVFDEHVLGRPGKARYLQVKGFRTRDKCQEHCDRLNEKRGEVSAQ